MEPNEDKHEDKEEEMDEIWRDFYLTLNQKIEILEEQLLRRDGLIHFAWLYDQVASTGTPTPVDDLASRIGCDIEEAGQLVQRCIMARLLLNPKRGARRCELSMIAKKMIAKMEIG